MEAAVIEQILREFDLRGAPYAVLHDGEDCTVRVGEDRYFLKILGAERREVESRLRFAEFARGSGLPVPRTFPTRSGERYARVGGRRAVLSEWIGGGTLEDRMDPATIGRCGALLARLHEASRRFEPPAGFGGHRWDEVYAPAPDGWIRGYPDFAPFAERIRPLDGDLPYGFIHADFHAFNLIDDGRAIWIVDFDDAGWGHYLFDLTWPAALFARHRPDADDYFGRLLDGYESVRPLTPGERRRIPEFKVAAGLAVVEMVHAAPIENDGPEAKEWFDAASRWLRRAVSECDGPRH